MEPFVIQCTTCRARLKVSDPALVGDIVGCPKCESFVQVTPPPGWQPPTPSAIAAAAIVPAAQAAAGASASGTIPVELAQKLGATSAKQPAAQVAAGKAAQAPPPLPATAAAAAGLSKTGLSKAALSTVGKAAAGGKAAATRATVGASSLIVPEPASEPGALAKLLTGARQHYWISAGSLTSLAAIATICWLAFGSKTEVPSATDPPAGEVALGSDRELGASEAGAKTGADAATNAAQRSNAKGGDTTNSEERSPADDAANRADELSGASANSASGSGQEPAANAPGEDESEPTSSFTARKDDPLDPIARALATEPEPLTSTNPGQAPDTLPDSPTGEVGSTAAKSPNAKSSDGMASTAESETALRARISTHLQDKLPATEFRDVPLAQFLAFLTDFSTVPISIDAESLEQAGKGPKTKITVKLAGETVEAALRAALAKPGLAFRIEPKRLVIVAGAAKP